MGFCGKPARKPHFVADCLLADKPIHLQVYLQGRVLVWRSEATPLVSRQAHAMVPNCKNHIINALIYRLPKVKHFWRGIRKTEKQLVRSQTLCYNGYAKTFLLM